MWPGSQHTTTSWPLSVNAAHAQRVCAQSAALIHAHAYTLYKCKNEVGCRDDTVPKTVRRIESMQQSSATPKNQRCREGVAEDCCMLSILLFLLTLGAHAQRGLR